MFAVLYTAVLIAQPQGIGRLLRQICRQQAERVTIHEFICLIVNGRTAATETVTI